MTPSKMFSYSLACIPEADADLLANLCGTGKWPPVNASLIANTESGFLLWIGSEGLDTEDRPLLTEVGFSASLAKVLDHAHVHGHGDSVYVMLDGDEEADPADGLDSHDW